MGVGVGLWHTGRFLHLFIFTLGLYMGNKLAR